MADMIEQLEKLRKEYMDGELTEWEYLQRVAFVVKLVPPSNV